MNPIVCTAVSVGVFVGTVACLEAGFRLGRVSAGRSPGSYSCGTRYSRSAVFVLLGVNLAGGISRLDAQCQRIVKEASAIRGLISTWISSQATNSEKCADSLDSTSMRDYARMPGFQIRDQELANAAQLQ